MIIFHPNSILYQCSLQGPWVNVFPILDCPFERNIQAKKVASVLAHDPVLIVCYLCRFY